MNTIQRIAKNTGVLLVSQIASYILGFFFVIYTARYLGAEGFGILAFALAFTGVFGVFADLGLRQLTVIAVAREKSQAGASTASKLLKRHIKVNLQCYQKVNGKRLL